MYCGKEGYLSSSVKMKSAPIGKDSPHVELIQAFEEQGFVAEDLFVVVRQNKPGVSSAVRQVHARKNHSYFLVLWKRTVGCAVWEAPE